MKKEQSDLCRKLIGEYRKCPDGRRKVNIRNKIFVQIQPFMLKWISSILSDWGAYRSKPEILSLSWDCFEHGLLYYKPDKPISVPNHFYNYTRFYLLNDLNSQKDEKEESLDIVKQDPLEKIYEGLEELKNFRSILDPEYHIVFDDAVMSLTPSNNSRQSRIKESPLNQYRYHESKRVFKIIIDYLIRR
jgi:hypothetical protein